MGEGPGVFTPGVIEQMKGYATSSYVLAQGAISALGGSIPVTAPTVPPAPLPIDIDRSNEPEFNEVADSGPASPSDPSIATYSMPNAPPYSVPSVPTLSNFTIPSFVDGTINPMTATMPDIDFGVPNIASITADDISYDTLFTTVKNKLESNILNGGTMLDPVIEAAIWQRNLERDQQALQDAVDKVTGQWAKFGFSLPDGLLSGSILAVNNEYMNKSLDRSREIAVKQAELEQTGMFKSLELGVSFENMALSHLNEFAKRRLEAAKANGDILVAVFKERVNLFNASLEGFKTNAIVYKATIEAEVARAEVYKAKMAGLQVLAQVDENRVKIYTAQIGAIEQLVNMYNTQVKAVATMYEVEKVKVELFKGQVDAYAAQLDALTKKYIGAVEAYKGKIQAYSSNNDVNIKVADGQTRINVAQYEASVKLMEATARIAEVQAQVKMEGLKGAAQAASNLAAGAMSAIHASVSDSFQNQYQAIHSYQE